MAQYVVPTKQIVSPSDLHAFLHSDAYTLINNFIEDLSSSVQDTPISPNIKTSKVGVLPKYVNVECRNYCEDSR